jgi:hypothetical protein
MPLEYEPELTYGLINNYRQSQTRVGSADQGE